MNGHAWYALGMAYHHAHQPEKVKEVALHMVRFDPAMTRQLIKEAERADLARERTELASSPALELDELSEIYVRRGIEPALARQVAEQLMAKGALEAHARDELGISATTTARPLQAALTSAATFSVGAAMPLLMVVVAPATLLVPAVSVASLVFLALLGAVGARAGGAKVLRATIRVTFWGALAMALTAGIGRLFGTVV